MTTRDGGARVLIYSHDTFGLGHLRRCRTIAHSLVENHKHLSVLILSGSPIIGSFDFRARVDFVRVPGVIKLRNGAYTSLNLHIDIEHTLSMRASIIRHTAEIFDPNVLIAKQRFRRATFLSPLVRDRHVSGSSSTASAMCGRPRIGKGGQSARRGLGIGC